MKTINLDVAVVAAGPAGLAAAVSAAENGASVAVFEKGRVQGGSGNMAMGLFAVESSIQKSMGIALTREEAFDRYMKAMEWNVDAKIVHDYFYQSADTIDWLQGMGVRFAGAIRNFPESEATWHVVLPANHRVGTGCASVMFQKMRKRAEELGVKFFMSTSVTHLKKENGQITGLFAKDLNDLQKEYAVSAKAVIVCTGGFGTNPRMVQEETGYTLGKDMFTFMIPGVVGDGISMVWDVGGKHGRLMMEKIIGHPMPSVMKRQNIQFLNFMQGSGIAVNKSGQRVCDESVMQNMALGANIIDYQQDRTLYKVIDSGLIQYFHENGQEFPTRVLSGDPTQNFDEVWEESARIYPDCAFAADSPEELEAKMGIPQGELIKSIRRYNDLASDGVDLDFGKPQRFMRELKGRRFYAYRFSLSSYGSLGGIKVNPDYEVIAEDGTVLPGLYAAGSDTCEIYNGTYYYDFPGNSLGYAVNSGRSAGRSAAEKIKTHSLQQ